jgi:BlaI family transcriptional regulator, penicillinase repressor
MEIILFERQLEIMQVLWERGSATVAEVVEALEGELAYTTVLTMLRRLEEKGYVGREEEGRAHRYHPRIEREQARASAVERITRGLFEGSRELLLTHLVAGEKLSQSQVRRLQELLEEQLGEEER